MSYQQFTCPVSDDLGLAGYRWDPQGRAIGAIVLIHGMGEHALRYAETAEALAGAGFVVFAYDHRGHGASVVSGTERGDLGPGGWSALVADIGAVVDKVRADHPDIPLVLVAHSMGSFATQQFLLDNSGRVDAVAMTGTAALDMLEPALDLEQDLDLAMFNAPFVPARTDFDWLTRDEAIVDAYLVDPLCGFGVDRASTREMFAAARRLGDAEEVAKIRSNLPIYIAVGSKDPVNADMLLVNVLLQRLRDAGIEDLTFHNYPDARHELFNETNRADVVSDLLDWLGRAVTPAHRAAARVER
ncbi:lysophospholipase [Nocardia sp. NBC_00565]|uniref:alpha/beta hydrolase n=1 Tax=Nocardia sp. NBC_00565 TaxID=2975993 RepID=UPI002E803B08|nr:alpha/beta hydrolase [Nocardia sp. NBC_00565]WUC06666.1 lysophospholipase [Nocardia sp. NBC_00565]